MVESVGERGTRSWIESGRVGMVTVRRMPITGGTRRRVGGESIGTDGVEWLYVGISMCMIEKLPV